MRIGIGSPGSQKTSSQAIEHVLGQMNPEDNHKLKMSTGELLRRLVEINEGQHDAKAHTA